MCSGRFWNRSISVIRLHMGDLTALAREGPANMFIGPEPVFDIFFCYV